MNVETRTEPQLESCGPTVPDGKAKIRSASRPQCILCGSAGKFIYSNQSDRLFGAGGRWNLKQCANAGCGLIWLDPMPLPEDLGRAYANYYTHAAGNPTGRMAWREKMRNLFRRGYWANEYDHQTAQCPFWIRSLGKIMSLSALHRSEADAEFRCLTTIPGGRLLDVGCGSGRWLLAMQERGWMVEGCDFDRDAVELARQKGLKVNFGSLEEQSYPDCQFDAITLNHVIEHVPDPMRTVAECARILKPGGKLVIFTPNNTSLSHRVFKQHWRGLEPPRHLHLFSMPAMRQMLAAAGYQDISIRPFVVASVIYESSLLRAGRTDFARNTPRSWPAWGMTRLFKWLELVLVPWKPSLGDCLIAVAAKR